MFRMFIYYTLLLCLKAKHVTCSKSVTAGRLGTLQITSGKPNPSNSDFYY